MNFHVLSQRAGVRVALVTPAHLAHIRLVARVHVRMFLAVAAVGETPLTALELTSERFLAIVPRSLSVKPSSPATSRARPGSHFRENLS